MNSAYANYLRRALDHYMVNDDEDDACRRFLDWLEHDYQPAHPDDREPSYTEYARAQGEHICASIDETVSLAGLDKTAIPDMDEFLGEWAGEITERIDDSVNFLDCLPFVCDRLGIDHKRLTGEHE